MAWRFNITNCSNQSTSIGYTEIDGSITIGRVYKVDGLCWQVTSQLQDGGNGPAAGVPLDNAETNYTNCADCTYVPPPPSSGISTYYIYTIRPCGNQSTAATVQAYRSTTDLFPGNSIKLNGVCWEVLSYDGSQSTIPAGSTNILDAQKFLDCLACANSVTTSSGPTGARIQYQLQACSGTGTLQGFRTADSTETFGSSLSLSTGQVYKVNNICYLVTSATWEQGNTGPGQNLTNLSTYITCAACQPVTPPSGGGGGTGGGTTFSGNRSGYNCTPNGCRQSTSGAGQYATYAQCCQNCNCPTTPIANNGISAYRYTLSPCYGGDSLVGFSLTMKAVGTVYNLAPNRCYTISTMESITGPVEISGVILDGRDRDIIINCGSCPALTFEGDVCCFVGDTKVCMADGTYKNIENVEIGELVKTSAGEISTVVDKITPIVGYRGLLSINGGKSFATPDHIFKSVNGEWITADIVLSKKSFKAFDNILAEGGIIKQLQVGDYIITENGPTLVESFEIIGAGEYDETVVYDLSLDSNSDHTYFVDGFAAHNCGGTNLPVIIDEVSFCDQYPDHPTCQPCYNTPCLTGCPQDCDKCPQDPRCNVVSDPCQDAVEPVQGHLLATRYVPTGLWTQFAVPEPEEYTFMIDSCWRWKYCVCRTQPDLSVSTYEYRVCLCGNNNNLCPAAGTLVGYECRNSSDPNSPNKYEKWAVYNNGNCGTYDQFIEANSVHCGFSQNPNCIQAGSLIRTYCVNSDKYGEFHNGNCGTYIEKIEVNSKDCGYKDPPPPPPPPPPTVVTEPVVSAIVYYPIDIQNTLKGKDISSFGLWTGNTPYLTTPSTESLATSESVSYILKVYDKPVNTESTCSAVEQFRIIYADYEGKGATDLGGFDNQTLTKAMYTQYAHVLLPHGQEKFDFGEGEEDYVYIIDISRDRFKQSLDPGNWQLTIASSSFSLETGSNSILSNMMTASYGNSTLTLVDEITKQYVNSQPVYLTTQNYNVVVGTIEDGVKTTYVTSSYASSSLIRTDVTHVIQSTTSTSNTAIVTGAEAIPFVFANVTGSFNLTRNYQDGYNPETNDYEIGYSGNWTGSFTGSLGGITFVPSKSSGSLFGTWYTTNTDNPLGNGKLKLGTFFTQPITYTTGSKTYNGFLKWGFQQGGKSGTVYSCPTCTDYFVTASQGQLNVVSSYTGSAFGYLMADSWGVDEIIEPTTQIIQTSSYTELINGNILYSIRSDSFGRVYPNHGVIVLSGKKLDGLGFNTNRSIDKNGYNTYRLFHSMKLVLNQGLTDSSGDVLGFYGRGIDIKHSSRYFVTLKNSQLNYSNNPTYITGSNGDIIDDFSRKNKSYFTSIGLYNPDKELLAIGKVSKPIMSSDTDESLFTVKISH